MADRLQVTGHGSGDGFRSESSAREQIGQDRKRRPILSPGVRTAARCLDVLEDHLPAWRANRRWASVKGWKLPPFPEHLTVLIEFVRLQLGAEQLRVGEFVLFESEGDREVQANRFRLLVESIERGGD